MGTKFVGSVDLSLLVAVAPTDAAPVVGSFVEVPEAEINEFNVSVPTLTGGTLVVALESDLGLVDGTQKVHEIGRLEFTTTGSKTLEVSIGGQPGGRRVRGRAFFTVGSSVAAIATAQLLETRSGR